MPSVPRLTPPATDAIRSSVLGLSQRPLTCRFCEERLRNPAKVRLRAISTTSSRSDYEPASDWRGLEWIGTKSWLRARDAREVEHERWGPRTQRTSPDSGTLYLDMRRAFIESLLLREATLPVAEREEVLERTKDKELDLKGVMVWFKARTGELHLGYESQDIKTSLYTEMGLAIPGAQEGKSLSDPPGKIRDWASVPFSADSELKFAVIKRVAQLTGVSLPDTVISGSMTPGEILAKLEKLPKPQSVLQALAADKRLEGLNNVTIYAKRQTFVDKDTAKGRWKIIEEELVERNLPLPKGVRRTRRLREKMKRPQAE